MRIVFVVLLALGLWPRDAHAAGTAKEVADACRPLLGPQVPQNFAIGLCVGSFTTLFALSGIVDQNKAPILGFCRPPNTQYLDLVRTFVQHVDSHPQDSQNFYAIEAVNAFVDVWPCRKR